MAGVEKSPRWFCLASHGPGPRSTATCTHHTPPTRFWHCVADVHSLLTLSAAVAFTPQTSGKIDTIDLEEDMRVDNLD